MKRAFALLLFFAMVLSLSACGAGEEPEKLPADGVTLNIVTCYGGDAYVALVAAYEQASGNTVNGTTGTPNEEWKVKVLTDFEAGVEPDVLFYFANSDAEPLISAGKVVDIATIRAVYPEYAGNMKDNLLPAASDGKNYTVPSVGYWEDLFVNVKVLEACGVDLPGPNYTWAQFLTDCETIKAAGYTPIACSLFEVPHYWFEFTVMNNGSLSDHMEVPTLDADGHLVMDEAAEKWIAALHDFQDLYDRGYFPANTLTAQDADTVELFANGEAAFLIDGSWKVGYFSGEHMDHLEDYAVAYVPAKGGRTASETIGGISMGYFITTTAWNDPAKRDAAVSFVAFMTSDEALSGFVTTEITALKSGAVPEGLNSLQQSAADANAGITGLSAAVQDTLTAEARADLFGNIQYVVTGAMTPEAALESALALN